MRPDHRSGNGVYIENCLVFGAAAIGLYCFAAHLTVLWQAWTSDPLRSSGIFDTTSQPAAPFVCIARTRLENEREKFLGCCV
jgi:outer membrane protein assembly factor BamB